MQCVKLPLTSHMSPQSNATATSQSLAPPPHRPIRPKSADSALKGLLRNYGLEEYYPKLAAKDFNLGRLSKLTDLEANELQTSLSLPIEHVEKFRNMLNLVKQVGTINDSRSTNRSVSPKNRLRLPRLKTTRTQSFEILPPKAFTPTAAQATDATFTGKAEAKATKDVEVATHFEIEQEVLLQELAEAREKIRQLEETLQRRGGLVVKEAEEVKGQVSPGSVKSETIHVPAFAENSDYGQLDKQELGHSYDSSKLRSTLTNLDIEEMCRCLAKTISKHIKTSMELRSIFSPTLPDFFEDFTCTLSDGPPSNAVSLPKILVTSFDAAFNDPEARAGVKPDENSIYNFSKNIIVRSQMEREASIVSLVYLERLVSRTGFRVNEANWKRLLFTALLLASKTWDDDTFENQHFASMFTMFSLQQINQMECVFLTLIDYSLIVRGSDFALYYFILRTYAEQKSRSFPVKALDVNTVRRLQSAAKAEVALKDIYREPLHKTS